MMSLFLIAALGLARDQTFLNLKEVSSLKESTGEAEAGTKVEETESVADLLRKTETERQHLIQKAETERLDLIQKAKAERQDTIDKLKLIEDTIAKKDKKDTRLRLSNIKRSKMKMFDGHITLPWVKYSANDDEYNEYKDKINDLTATMEKSSAILDKNTEEKKTMEASRSAILDKYTEERSRLEDEVSRLTRKAKDQDELITKTENRLATAIKNQTDAETNKEKIEQEIGKLRAQLHDSQISHKSIEDKLQAEVKSLKNQVLDLSGLTCEENVPNDLADRFKFQENVSNEEEVDVSSTRHNDGDAEMINELYKANEKLTQDLQAAQEQHANGVREMLLNLTEEKRHTEEAVADLNKAVAHHKKVELQRRNEAQAMLDKQGLEQERVVKKLLTALRNAQSGSGVKNDDLLIQLESMSDTLSKKTAEHRQEKSTLENRISELEEYSKNNASDCDISLKEEREKNEELTRENSMMKHYFSMIASAQYLEVSFEVKDEMLEKSLLEVLDQVKYRAEVLMGAAQILRDDAEEMKKNEELTKENSMMKDYFSMIARAQYLKVSFEVKGEMLEKSLQEVLAQVNERAQVLMAIAEKRHKEGTEHDSEGTEHDSNEHSESSGYDSP